MGGRGDLVPIFIASNYVYKKEGRGGGAYVDAP
jgi:hypothetical protein